MNDQLRSLRNIVSSFKQVVRAANRRRLHRRRRQCVSYAEWASRYSALTPEVLQALATRLQDLPRRPLISLVMPVYNPAPAMLREAIESVRAQIYPEWELCIADDCSPDPSIRTLLDEFAAADPRIRVVFRERNGHISAASNSAIALARGEYLALIDHDDLLPRHAMLVVAETVLHFPSAGVIYSDEDKIGATGDREGEYFKCDWNYDLFLSHNMISHLGVYKTDLVREVGGFREGYEGSQDYDLALRCVERAGPQGIVHIPHVLYHWRAHDQSTAGAADAKPYAYEAARRAIQDHLDRTGLRARVEIQNCGQYRVHYALPEPPPLVSVIVPTRNGSHLLRKCITGLLDRTDYPALEIIVVDNGSDESATLAYLKEIASWPQLRVIRDPRPFNYSQLNNVAAEQAQGEFLVLLNDDVEVMEADWLREMVSRAALPGVGAVGAKLLYPDRRVQHAGVILGINYGGEQEGVAGLAHKGLKANHSGYVGRAILAQNFSAVTAACLVVRRSIYLEVGGLDEEHLAVAFNDIDFCLRLRERGYRNVWTPYAVLYHHESVSRGSDALPRNRERFESETAYMRRRWGGILKRDPAYNPNLSFNNGDFALASPPRVSLLKPWFVQDKK